MSESKEHKITSVDEELRLIELQVRERWLILGYKLGVEAGIWKLATLLGDTTRRSND